MKISFRGDIKELEHGMDILSAHLGFERSEDGLPVDVKRSEGSLTASFDSQTGTISYHRKIHFFRALGLFIEALSQKNSFKISEEPQFDSNGIMLDVSRNAVLRVDSLKWILEKMALMGLNQIMLYSEDTYTIEGKPYFGYMRGRYSYNELKEFDDYADLFGIEVIPCIQTLAHLTQALKWDYAEDLKDTDDILLAGSEKTYAFIDEMIACASAPFKSKRIHIGMDEAHYLGLGNYLSKNGYRRRFDIMNEHLKRVMSITSKHGLSPMIWSDMYFRLGSRTGDYYDPEALIPEDVVQDVPKELQLVYWDYYHNSESEYENYIKKHQRFGKVPVFAGGIWTWAGICVNYKKTFQTTNAALSACKKIGVREVFATLWGDDGAETNFISALLGLQLYAEHGYKKEPDMKELEGRFEFCTGCSMQAFWDIGCFDAIPGAGDEETLVPSNPSKYLLWQDLLLGLFDRNIEGLDLSGYYSKLAAKIDTHLSGNGNWSFVFDPPAKLASVLALKSDMGIRIKKYYDGGNMGGLKKIAVVELPDLLTRVEALRLSHMRQWMRTCKPFGWEVIDIRYGGLIARIRSAGARLTDFIEGKTAFLEELDEERLYFDGPVRPEGVTVGHCNSYKRIVSASPM